MEKFYIVAVLLLIMQSCSTPNKDKEKLIGNWSIIHGLNEFEFYQDSLIVNELGMSYINQWKIDGSKIYLETIDGLEKFGIKTKELDYKLSVNRDTLYLKRHSDSVFSPPILRIENRFDYLLKQLQIKIDLPTKNKLISNKKKNSGLDVYVGFRDGALIAKTDSNKTSGLEEIIGETNAFVAEQKIKLGSINFQFNLLVDKRINRIQIDSIKSILEKTGYDKMFRVYTNEKVDYEKIDWKDELHWFGIYE